MSALKSKHARQCPSGGFKSLQEGKGSRPSDPGIISTVMALRKPGGEVGGGSPVKTDGDANRFLASSWPWLATNDAALLLGPLRGRFHSHPARHLRIDLLDQRHTRRYDALAVSLISSPCTVMAPGRFERLRPGPSSPAFNHHGHPDAARDDRHADL